jgi:hypothetical protein
MERKIWGMIFLLIMGVLSSCTFHEFRGSPEDVNTANQTNTAAAATMVDLQTRVATLRTPTPYGMPTSTVTPLAVVVTKPPSPTITPSPSPVPPPRDAPCNQVEFLHDATIPDWSMIPPNTTFTKSWKVRNSGSCTWNYQYALVFGGQGNAMNAPASMLLASKDVKPGDTAAISVRLLAPAEPGNYESFWRLRAGDGKVFGPNGNGMLSTRIRVGNEYSFAEQMCSAAWSSAPNNPLPCPGSEGDSGGYVRKLENPMLEDGQARSGIGLLTAPLPAAGGVIIGRYPPIVVPKGSNFRALVSCQPGSSGCYVRFKVTYQFKDQVEQKLDEWNEGLEGGINTANTDLSFMAGQEVTFTLYVYVTGNPSNSRGIWFNPRISP